MYEKLERGYRLQNSTSIIQGKLVGTMIENVSGDKIVELT